MQSAVDAAIFGDSVKIFGARVFPASGKLNERNLVGSVAVNFVGAKKNENGFRRMLARGFEKINCAEGVDFKIEDGNVASLVVRGLRGTVNDEIEAARTKKFVERGAVANVGGEVRKSFGGRFEAFEIPERVAGGAEKFAAHVVVNADDGVALAIEVCDSFRANESAASGDEN